MAQPPAKLNAEERKTAEAAESPSPFGKAAPIPPGFKFVVPDQPVMLVAEGEDMPSAEDLTPEVPIAPPKPKVLLVAPDLAAPPERNPAPDPLPDPYPPLKGPVSEEEEDALLAELLQKRAARRVKSEPVTNVHQNGQLSQIPLPEEPTRFRSPQSGKFEATTPPISDQVERQIASSIENLKQGNVSDPIEFHQETSPQERTSAHNPINESRSHGGLPSYRCEFEGRDIFVGLPWYKTSNPVTSFALLALALDFGRDKIRFDLSMGDAMIHHSRNILAQRFLDTDAKWLFMMDDDIIPSIGRPAWSRTWVANMRKVQDVPLQRHVLHRLIGSGKTLVGGAYFGRQEGAPIMCSNRNLAERARAYEDAVVEVDWVATGCLLIHRKVFEDMQKKFPELKSEQKDIPFDYFRPMNHETGEDVSFCIRAKKSGHQPHVDLGLPVSHVGYRCY